MLEHLAVNERLPDWGTLDERVALLPCCASLLIPSRGDLAAILTGFPAPVHRAHALGAVWATAVIHRAGCGQRVGAARLMGRAAPLWPTPTARFLDQPSRAPVSSTCTMFHIDSLKVGHGPGVLTHSRGFLELPTGAGQSELFAGASALTSGLCPGTLGGVPPVPHGEVVDPPWLLTAAPARPPAARLHGPACSGPVHAVRSSVWPRSHGWRGSTGCWHRWQVNTWPRAMRAAYSRRLAWCTLP